MKIESDAYIEGREAGLARQMDVDNPYPIGSDEAMDWEDGRTSQNSEDWYEE